MRKKLGKANSLGPRPHVYLGETKRLEVGAERSVEALRWYPKVKNRRFEAEIYAEMYGSNKRS